MRKSIVIVGVLIAFSGIMFWLATDYGPAIIKPSDISSKFKNTPNRPSTPIYDAVEWGNEEQVQSHFYYKTANINGESGNVPLLLVAISKGHSHIVKQLLSYKVDPNTTCNRQYIAVNKMAKYDIPYNYNTREISALSLAIKKGHTNIARILLENGADANSDIKVAIKGENLETIKLLLDYGATINSEELLHATESYNYQLVKLFANSKITKRQMKPALRTAIKSKDNKMIMILIEAGADPFRKIRSLSSSQENKIFKAVWEGDYDFIKKSLNAGVDVDLSDSGLRTLVYKAAHYNKIKIVKFLIDAGADVNLKTDYLTSPLHAASGEGHFEVVKILIDAGADVNSKDKRGVTPLQQAQKVQSISLNRYYRDWSGVIKLLRKQGSK